MKQLSVTNKALEIEPDNYEAQGKKYSILQHVSIKFHFNLKGLLKKGLGNISIRMDNITINKLFNADTDTASTTILVPVRKNIVYGSQVCAIMLSFPERPVCERLEK